MREILIGQRPIGDGFDPWIVAEVGINHDGNFDKALALVRMAAECGADAVKFQVRTPRLCVPRDQWDVPKEWRGEIMSYIKYREMMEFNTWQYRDLDRHCHELGIPWFASVWDNIAVGFMEQFHPPAYKVPSAKLTDWSLLRRCMNTGAPLILSTGMSEWNDVETAMSICGGYPVLLMHCTSTYPCPDDELNLRVIELMRDEFPNTPVGFSNHSPGILAPTLAMALGANAIEAHITLDRAMPGSDHGASFERPGLERLVKYARLVRGQLGDGTKKVYPSEYSAMRKLRG